VEIQLFVKKGKASADSLSIHRFPTYIGRNKECQLRIAARQVSRRHCVLKEKEGWLAVSDLDSCNGTAVNGRLIRNEVTLYPGDLLEVGPIIFQIDYRTPSLMNEPATPTDTLVSVAADDATPLSRENAYELSERLSEMDRLKSIDNLDTHCPGEQGISASDSGSKIIVLDDSAEADLSPARPLFSADYARSRTPRSS
jgi:pSer/pThr/pTyr-binding forkhead associated (FHA) protein